MGSPIRNAIAALLLCAGPWACHLAGGVDDLAFAGDGEACLDPSDCPEPTNPCTVRICQEQRCVAEPQQGGAAADWAQVPEDCEVLRCSSLGEPVAADDPSDLPSDDGNPCTDEVCDDNGPAHPPLASGTSCGDGGTCNGTGDCVGG